MKKNIACLIGFGITLGLFAETLESPKASLVLKAMDEGGAPIEGADVAASFEVSGSQTKAKILKGKSDAKGLFTFTSETDTGFVTVGASKPGYYPTDNVKSPFSTVKQGRWQPWGSVKDVVLKQIGKPIPMYARKVSTALPRENEPIGYDLIVSDWCAPLGKGSKKDLIFNGRRAFESWKNFDASLEIGFSNDGDGLFTVLVDEPETQGSRLRLSGKAPVDGYVGTLRRSMSRKNQGPLTQDRVEGQNYYLRVRTVLDEHRSVISALYGKIYGDFRLDPVNGEKLLIAWTYYVNPNSNDNNVEFDVNRNLFRDLPSWEEVTKP